MRRTRLLAAAGMVLVPLILGAACESSTEPDAGPADSPSVTYFGTYVPITPSVAAGQGSAGRLSFSDVKDSPLAAAFVAAFRAQHPDLAEGRSDSGIANDVTHICLDDLRDPATGQPRPDGDAAALAKIPARFERNGIIPGPSTSDEILALAKSTVCDHLDELAATGG
ncbi:hypothetical protein I6A84_33825 [Frankia sp. CNm7]|uniref:DUF732 domain-containing protein n=1 Tax=Frankia nepalensis TaxID=1836974 RepID=A0A937RDJ6_9ACTN|nr:hypothetical protein [Frankia nepalensis]MBL7498315.1 hypothetical protein [Frankia nepalensis]MBL7512984.1 hypothetical protein [Frankia nepalensis]MBL7522934.1 hypothetical protein [Frankia nepalensis]MBL7630138.1 hypothetical protein [Frankia nepalensis]